MRLGIFGGSFDPPHHGHLLLADCCWRQANLDEVAFVPAAYQPFKPDGPIAPDADRLAMLAAAIAGRPEFSTSTIELERGGVSYTVDTLRELKRTRPDASLFFLMGADSLADFPKWREPAAVCELATPLVVSRAGRPAPDFSTLAPIVSQQRLHAIVAARVEMPPTPISSSEIRRRIAEGGDWRTMVPHAVAAYIDQRQLYR